MAYRVYLGHRALACAVASAALMSATSAHAQQVQANGRTVYEAAYFTTFAPANALQIVQRVPGFNLELGDQEVRGFGQAAGNVVINGQRPSSKSDTLDVILMRIPASRVARVEIGSGDLFGSEYSGKSQVLNLVLTDTGGISGTVEATVQREFVGKFFPQANASILLKTGPSTFNFGVAIKNKRTSETGFDRVTELPSGREIEYRDKLNRIKNPNYAVTGSWEYNEGENRVAHLNGKLAFDRFSLTQFNQVRPATGPLRNDRLTQRYNRRDIEIGGDITRPLAGGGFKVIGLITRRVRDDEDVSLLRVTENLIGGSAQTIDDHRDETVGRIVWTRPRLWGWNVELGAEAALNKLDSNVNLFALNAAGDRTRIDLPVDQAVVKEYRGETFLNIGRPLSSNLRTDLGLTWEMSRLTVTGDAESERALRFLKPKATFDWRPAGGWRFVLSIQRTVAQLQFEDFISGAELSNDRVNGGNTDLLPQRAWETLFTAEHALWGDGLVRFEAGYNRISLLQDRIPTPEGFDAPGNLGNGEEWILRSRVDAPLGRFGIRGGRLTLYASYVSSSVVDPYTLLSRHFSGNSLFAWEANFRQDLGKFAWGLNLSGNTPSTFFRLNEEDRNWSEMPYISAFTEYRPNARLTITAGLDNATGVPAFRRRTFFAPNRASTVPVALEYRMRNSLVVPYLTVKRSF